MQTFYMVLNEATKYTAAKHQSKHSAVVEARRLARSNPGTPFVVLEAVGHAVYEEPAKFVEYEPEMPF